MLYLSSFAVLCVILSMCTTVQICLHRRHQSFKKRSVQQVDIQVLWRRKLSKFKSFPQLHASALRIFTVKLLLLSKEGLYSEIWKTHSECSTWAASFSQRQVDASSVAFFFHKLCIGLHMHIYFDAQNCKQYW
jgi:hypothetical protein